jgi:hypothetical protein
VAETVHVSLPLEATGPEIVAALMEAEKRATESTVAALRMEVFMSKSSVMKVIASRRSIPRCD